MMPVTASPFKVSLVRSLGAEVILTPDTTSAFAEAMRLATEEMGPQDLLFSGRFHVEGDLALATRVPEMFGAPPQF